MTTTDAVAILGLASGITGTVLGLLNYLRDRARVDVLLQWDMAITKDPEYDQDKLWGAIRITNAGRRTVHASHVSLKLPDGRFPGESHLLIMGGVEGKSLAEGSAPVLHIFNQDGMEKYASAWHLIRAQVSDTNGRVWKSSYVSEKPSWANVAP